MSSPLFDPGLQPERTALAWVRTTLVVTVGSLVGLRVLPHYWGTFGLVVAGAGVLTSLALLGLATGRYRLTRLRLTGTSDPVGQLPGSGDRAPGSRTGRLPDGRLPALLAAVTLSASVIAAALVLWVATRGTP